MGPHTASSEVAQYRAIGHEARCADNEHFLLEITSPFHAKSLLVIDTLRA